MYDCDCICDILYDLSNHDLENETDIDYRKKRGGEIFYWSKDNEITCIHCGSTYYPTKETKPKDQPEKESGS